MNVAEADLVYEGTQVGGRFGLDVQSAGEQDGDGVSDLLVAAHAEDGGRGALYLYRSAEGLLRIPLPVPDDFVDGGAAPAFGRYLPGILGSEDVCPSIIAGAYGLDVAGQEDVGAVFVFAGCPSEDTVSWPLRGDSYAIPGVEAGQQLGSRLEAGDINGDGVRDIVARGLGDSSVLLVGRERSGGVWQVDRRVPFGDLGFFDMVFGDFDGDGQDELALGDWWASPNDVSLAGAAELYRLGGGQSSAEDWRHIATVQHDVPGALFAHDLVAGDFDGDRVDDLLTGAHGVGAGSALLVTGRALAGSAQHQQAMWAGDQIEFTGVEDGDRTGARVGVVDINTDGHDDLLISSLAISQDGDPSQENQGYVILGSPDPVARDLNHPDFFIEGPGWTGALMRGLGDINGDGCEDLGVTAGRYDVDGVEDAGALFVFYGWGEAP